jgi:hypothetical protein
LSRLFAFSCPTSRSVNLGGRVVRREPGEEEATAADRHVQAVTDWETVDVELRREHVALDTEDAA